MEVTMEEGLDDGVDEGLASETDEKALRHTPEVTVTDLGAAATCSRTNIHPYSNSGTSFRVMYCD